MSKLYSFLYPIRDKETKDVFVSERFKDEKGEPILFKIRALSQEENDAITRKSNKNRKVNGSVQTQLDTLEYGRRLIVAATVFPDFSSEELCEQCGTLNPLEVPGKVLLAGEYSRLLGDIVDFCGFGADEIEEAAKN